MTKKSSGSRIWWAVAVFVILGLALLLPKLKEFEEANSVKTSRIPSDLLEDITSAELTAKIKNSTAPVKLVNLWATWCGPCVEEFPAILELREKYKDRGLEVFFVSTDMLEEREAVEEFLANQKVDFKTFLKNEADQKFISSFHPDWSGALPASLIYDAQGSLVSFWTGDASFEEFEEKVLNVLEPKTEDAK